MKQVLVPKVWKVSLEDYSIEMDFIEGIKLKDYLNQKDLPEQ